MSKKKDITVVIACRNANGSPDFVYTKVSVSQSQYDTGDHYDLAEEKALEDDYEGPFVCFDEVEMPEFLKQAVAQDKIPRL